MTCVSRDEGAPDVTDMQVLRAAAEAAGAKREAEVEVRAKAKEEVRRWTWRRVRAPQGCSPPENGCL